MATSGQGISDLEVTLNYGDGSTQSAGPFTIPDWFGGADYAIKGLDRVDRRNDNPDGNSTDPRLYDFIIQDVNPEKLLVSIHFEKTFTGSGRAGVFAISGDGEFESKPVPISSRILFSLFLIMALFVTLHKRI